ncbi:DEKNAAC100550 [Brettanomyces naardenensis]|uniref:DEKNAAC100550 n=1 Tax=Brettanomyces naardenensis TaxID=13370 RepID=A0A448YGK4_BRENA|nr:DEKNAAC100550 [Brettanomyces naardenensis]
MGVYDPSRDKDLSEKVDESQIDSDSPIPSSISDSVKSIVSKTNDLTSSSFNRMLDMSRQLFNSENNPYSLFDDSIGNTPFFKTFKSLYGSESRPDGYVTYPIPSVELYSNCKKMNGLAAWDTHGYWHCLFPRANIPEEALSDPDTISREDVEADLDHKKYGVFFENFNDLMDWKVKMRDLMKEKKDKQWSQYREQEKAKWDFLNPGEKKEREVENVRKDEPKDSIYDIHSSTSSSLPETDGVYRYASGTSSSTEVNTLDNGDIEKTTCVRRYYDDGSSEEREYKEIIDAKTGKSKTVDQNITKFPNKSAARKGGWFWNKKGKNGKNDDE